MNIKLLIDYQPLEIWGERGREVLEGEWIHQALYFLERFPPLVGPEEIQTAVDRALDQVAVFCPNYSRFEQSRQRLLEILTEALVWLRGAVSERPEWNFFFFGPEVPVLCEYEIMEVGRNKTHLYRLDRLVLFPKETILVDFKLHEERKEDQAQIKRYRRLAAQIFGPVRAFLFYLVPPRLKEIP